MLLCSCKRLLALYLVAVFLLASVANAASGAAWNGTLIDPVGKPIAGAILRLLDPGGRTYTATTPARQRLRNHQQDSGELSPDLVFAEGDLLKRSRLRFY